MAGADIIITQIAIEGQDDVIHALEAMGEAGKNAFSALESAIGLTGGVITAFIGAIGATGVAMEEWSRRSANSTIEISNLATAAGTTIQQMSGLRGALQSFGADTGFLDTAMRRLSFTIESTWQEMVKQVKGAADQYRNNALAVSAANLSVQQSENSLLNTRRSLQELISGQATDPQVKRMQDIRDATLAVEQAELAVSQARQKAVEASKKQAEDQKNDIGAITDAVNKVAGGFETLTQAGENANLEIQNVIKGIIGAASPIGDALSSGLTGFQGNLQDIVRLEPKVQDVFFKLADFMKNSGDAALNTALAYRLLGRNISQDVIAGLAKGSDALKEQVALFEKLGFVLGDTDKKAATEFQEAFGKLSFEFKTLLTQIGNLFAPSFTDGFKILSTFLENNRQEIINFAQTVANEVRPTLLAFFKILTGETLGAGEPAWAVTFQKAARNIATFITETVIPALGRLFRFLSGEEKIDTSGIDGIVLIIKGLGTAFEGIGKLIGPTVDLIVESFGLIGSALNEVFGTQLDEAAVAFAAFGIVVLTAINPLLGALAGVALAIGLVKNKLDEINNRKIRDETQELAPILNQAEATANAVDKAATTSDDARDRLIASVRGFREQLVQAIADKDLTAIKSLRTDIEAAQDQLFEIDRDAANKGRDEFLKARAQMADGSDKTARQIQQTDKAMWAQLVVAAKEYTEARDKAAKENASGNDQKDLAGLIDRSEKAAAALEKVQQQRAKTAKEPVADPATDETNANKSVDAVRKSTVEVVRLMKDGSDASKKYPVGIQADQPAIDAATAATKDATVKIVSLLKDGTEQIKPYKFKVQTDDAANSQAVTNVEQTTVKIIAAFKDGFRQIHEAQSKVPKLTPEAAATPDLSTPVGQLEKAASDSSPIDVKVRVKPVPVPLTASDKEALEEPLKKETLEIQADTKLKPISTDEVEKFLAALKNPTIDTSQWNFGQPLDGLQKQVEEAVQKLKDTFKPNPIDTSGWTVKDIGEPIVESARESWNKVKSQFDQSPIEGASAWDFSAVNTLFDALKTTASTDYTEISTQWSTSPANFSGWDTGNSYWQQLIQSAQDTWSQMAQIMSQPLPSPSGDGGGGDGGGFASGGRVLGRPGIDTNLAWLTHNEFVQPVRAVEKFGLDFMEMVRRVDVDGVIRWANQHKLPGFNAGGLINWSSSFDIPRFNVGGIVNWANNIALPAMRSLGRVDWTHDLNIPRFFTGGHVHWDSIAPQVAAIMSARLAPASVPAFASGGANQGGGTGQSQGRPLTLVIDGQKFGGLHAPENVARQLMKFAVSRQVSSAGKKPNWVR
jgi:hypothetical protein